MPGKQKVPAPIDRPLSRAYLRGFLGWSTAYPPGVSEPASLRVMENMLVDRNGALNVRPGLRYLTYETAPDIDGTTIASPGIAFDRPLVGTQEPFYVRSGNKALLFAVREADNTVGFRALLFSGAGATVYELTDDAIGFQIPQGASTLNFTEATTYVKYVQINNRILALSDAGEAMRLFIVGEQKIAKRLNTITAPEWADTDKLKVVHPDQPWIAQQTKTVRRNSIFNPSFESGIMYWTPNAYVDMDPASSPRVSGSVSLKIYSKPLRTNMIPSPLHAVDTLGTKGWASSGTYGAPDILKSADYMVVQNTGKGTFYAYGAKFSHGVEPGGRYTLTLTYVPGSHVSPKATVTFYGSNGAQIGKGATLTLAKKSQRFQSGVITAPDGAVWARLWLGGYNEERSQTSVKFKDLVFAKVGESSSPFSGSSGTNYFWVGTANASASVYHPPQDIAMMSEPGYVEALKAVAGSIYVYTTGVTKTYDLYLRTLNKDGAQVGSTIAQNGTTVANGWHRAYASSAATNSAAIRATLQIVLRAMARGHVAYIDAALLESGTSALNTYFDGSTTSTSTTINSWEQNRPHGLSYSLQTIYTDPASIPVAEAPTANTLIATGGATANPYKFGFFYTFQNEVGESAPSKITEIRTARPWSNWRLETPNTAGEPSGTVTDNADLAADQLVAYVPAEAYARAVAEGALRWNLYAFTWSDQDPVPVTAARVAERELYPDAASSVIGTPLSHAEGGWLKITPARRVGINEMVLPSNANRENFSRPLGARTGLVAGDRIVLIGDPAEMSTIRWSSNRVNENTNFTASSGGGAKTLTAGNLAVPAAVVLWQNPQSVDTLTILCMGSDGVSPAYYMTPATVQSSASGTLTIMGFEETTSTPGTLAPFAAEVMNNALYRPTDKSLLKSTAQNYNINHKSLTDKIANMWHLLQSRQLMVSSQLDNRLYLLVHNPNGELLQTSCRGNEVWVYDIGSEAGVWSRFLVQGISLRPLDVGGHTYMGVTRPEGLYYLDPMARDDEYVQEDLEVARQPIEWRFETNTQGANRAHDAWAHLQMVGILLGNFSGTMRYGIRGKDMHGSDILVSKQVSDLRSLAENSTGWDVEDFLQVRRDFKEWVLFGSSVEGLPSSGQIGYAQYRYTPTSVNVGYEFGSVETFEYGMNVAEGADAYAENGIPLPYLDYSR